MTTTTLPKGRPTPKQPKPRQRSYATVDHERRGRKLSPEIIAQRRRANQMSKRSRKINRPRQKRRGQISALAWLTAFSILFGAALYYSTPANALSSVTSLRISVTWIGGSCWTRSAVGPAANNGHVLAQWYVTGCNDTVAANQIVRPGDWYGIDPGIGDAFAVACTVKNAATGAIVLTDFATKGNGHNVTCLGKWI